MISGYAASTTIGARSWSRGISGAEDPRAAIGHFRRLRAGAGSESHAALVWRVFAALQTHLIEGAENNWTTFFTSRQFEVARHWSESLHSFAPEALLMSKRRLDSMSPADRALVLDVAAQSVPYMRALWDKQEAESRAAVEKAGVQVVQVDRKAFERATAPMMAAYLRDSELMRLHRQIRAVA